MNAILGLFCFLVCVSNSMRKTSIICFLFWESEHFMKFDELLLIESLTLPKSIHANYSFCEYNPMEWNCIQFFCIRSRASHSYRRMNWINWHESILLDTFEDKKQKFNEYCDIYVSRILSIELKLNKRRKNTELVFLKMSCAANILLSKWVK